MFFMNHAKISLLSCIGIYQWLSKILLSCRCRPIEIQVKCQPFHTPMTLTPNPKGYRLYHLPSIKEIESQKYLFYKITWLTLKPWLISHCTYTHIW